jgi:predicted transcriptional regulator of viral defense system
MKTIEEAIKIIQSRGGTIRTSEAIKAGIAPKTFYSMRDQGILIRLSRGLYHLAEAPILGDPDLLAVSIRYPKAVICLISALDYHNLTEQIPHFVYIALPRDSEMPRIEHPPLQIFWLSDKFYQAGIQEVSIDQQSIKIYSPEKTIADCFKFRNKIGLDVAIDAIQRYFGQPSDEQNFNSLLEYAKLNRIEKIMMPYIETLL